MLLYWLFLSVSHSIVDCLLFVVEFHVNRYMFPFAALMSLLLAKLLSESGKQLLDNSQAFLAGAATLYIS